MKSTAPWSVKGIEQDARETAKEAARREGKTLGEWLNGVIYTAGDSEDDPASAGQDGPRMRDLATAIEFLNQKTTSAEEKTLASVNDLARSFSNVVERVQRLERDGGARTGDQDPGVELRLQAIEEKVADNGRIEALKALEKAVGQVALQFNTSQKEALARLGATETNLQKLTARIEALPDTVANDTTDTKAITFLKDAVDGMSSRVARAERIASEAAKMNADARNSADAEFVERTGKRLRILGDEIKRGGDQIRGLESSISRLAGQIDAAEKRSADSVEKVALTISGLREELKEAESVESEKSRREAETAVTALAKRTDGQIADLHNSFGEIIRRLDALRPAAEEVDNAQQGAFSVPLDTDEPTAADDLDGVNVDEFDHAVASPNVDKAEETSGLGSPEEAIAALEASFKADDAIEAGDAPATPVEPALTPEEREQLEARRVQDEIDAAFASTEFAVDASQDAETSPIDNITDGDSAEQLDQDFDEFLDVGEGTDFEEDSDDFSVALDDVEGLSDANESDQDTAPEAVQSHEESAEILADVRAALGFDTDNQKLAAVGGSDESAQNDPSNDLDLQDLMSELDELGDPLSDTDKDLALLDQATEQPAPTKKQLAARKKRAKKKIATAKTPDSDHGDLDLALDDAPAGDNYLKAARAAAKEAASRAEEEESGKVKRRLSPRQRAILAAKRKKAERNSDLNTLDDDAPLTADGAPLDIAEDEAPKRRRKAKKKNVHQDQSEAEDEMGSLALDDENDQEEEEKSGPFSALPAGLLRPRSIAIALGVGLLLVLLALLLLPRGGGNSDNASLDLNNPAAPPTLKDQPSPQTQPTLEATLSPRELYLDAMGALAVASTEAEEREGLRLLQEAAALGHPPAQLQLGEFFKLGRGVERDFERARAWYERAANGGNILAMHRLGVMTARGDGGDVDVDASIAWFEQAGRYGLVDSQFNLGATLQSSETPEWRERAYYWYALAARNGDTQAEEQAAQIAGGISAEKRAELDAEVAAWTPIPQNEAANERAGA